MQVKSALALFMPWIFANNAHYPFALYDFALSTNSLH
jgi:hypothetical protein